MPKSNTQVLNFLLSWGTVGHFRPKMGAQQSARMTGVKEIEPAGYGNEVVIDAMCNNLPFRGNALRNS